MLKENDLRQPLPHALATHRASPPLLSPQTFLAMAQHAFLFGGVLCGMVNARAKERPPPLWGSICPSSSKQEKAFSSYSNQWFSVLDMLQNHPESCSQCRLLGLTPRVSDFIDMGWGLKNVQFPHADFASSQMRRYICSGTTRCKPLL